MGFNVLEHVLVPHHEIVPREKVEKLKERYGPLEFFPKIRADDPVVTRLGAKPGDVIRIVRPDEPVPTYRVVVEE
ncbi:MAG: DNA-directed RNA polymerase subunit H [Thermoproteota archaeon]|nr:MAG: DNA-directed RNA polymerase subunit H [Candidatus Korarchaeota archaeon]